MERVRFIDIKAAVAKAVNLCPDDPRVLDYANDACEGLLYEMMSVGTYARYRVCVNENCITWPRQLETIEAVAICNRPGTVRNQWFEFLDYGPGILNENSSIGLQLVDAGEAAAFDRVTGTGKKLAIYCDNDEADDAIILQYYDKDANWVRTEIDGEWSDGEAITLPDPGNYAYTSLEVMPDGFVRAIKPQTNGTVRLYEYDTVALTYKPLAYYEPDEEVPVYRRSTIAGLQNMGCCEKTGDCGKLSVTVQAKLRFIPVRKDNDFLCIAHRRAVRLAAQAVLKEQADQLPEAAQYWMLAIAALKKQTEHHIGHGAVQPIKVVGAGVWGGAIPVLR